MLVARQLIDEPQAQVEVPTMDMTGRVAVFA